MKKIFAVMAVATMTTMAPSAFAGSPSVGKATVFDATLAGDKADSFAFSTVNPNQGPNGNTSGFSTTFAPFAASNASVWSLVGKGTGDVTSASQTINGAKLTWTFDVDSTNKSGTFSVKSDKAIVLDLTMAVHAANASGAWLFDNVALQANTVQNGTFAIKWLNNGGKVPGFSNVTVFARDVNVSPVPEPETYAMMLAALGSIALLKRRKQK